MPELERKKKQKEVKVMKDRTHVSPSALLKLLKIHPSNEIRLSSSSGRKPKSLIIFFGSMNVSRVASVKKNPQF